MAKNPAFSFYAQDYLVDTLRWSREAKSLHVDLLCESWANGALADNNGAPDGLNNEDLKIWQKIKHKWALNNGFWISEKLEVCRENRKKFLERQCLTGKKGGRPKKENPEETQAFLENKLNEKPLGEEKEYSKGKEGVGEKPLEDSIVPEMIREFRKAFPKYPLQEAKDFHACLQISCKIGKEKDYNDVLMLSDGREYVLKRGTKL